MSKEHVIYLLRLMYLAITKEIDLNIVFQYLILPEPPCFVHPDSSLRESKKAAVFHLMKEKIESTAPSTVDMVIADGMFIIQSCVKDRISTFSEFARTILIRILKLSKY